MSNPSRGWLDAEEEPPTFLEMKPMVGKAVIVTAAPSESSQEWIDIRSRVGYLPGMLPPVEPSLPPVEPSAESVEPLRALVVGGLEKWVKGTLRQNLSRFGKNGRKIVPAWHWCDTAERSIPADCDLVFVVTDKVSHKLTDVAHPLAREAGIPYVLAMMKWAQSIGRMEAAGFTEIRPRKEAPVIAPPVVAESPTLTPVETRAAYEAQRAQRRHWVSRVLLEAPSFNNDQVWSRMRREVRDLFDMGKDRKEIQHIRTEFGISVQIDKGWVRTVLVDPEKYEPACAAMGVTPSYTGCVKQGSIPVEALQTMPDSLPGPSFVAPPPAAVEAIVVPFSAAVGAAASPPEPVRTVSAPPSALPSLLAVERTSPPSVPLVTPTPTELRAALALLCEAAIARGYRGVVVLDLNTRTLSGQRVVVSYVEDTVEAE
jgi:hypothetical protein